MRAAYGFTVIEIGNGARYFQQAVIAAGRQMFLGGRLA